MEYGIEDDKAELFAPLFIIFTELIQNIKMKTLSGQGCVLYYNDFSALIRINISNISVASDSILSGFSLPEGVAPILDIYISPPIMTSGWVPTGQTAYIIVGVGQSEATIRYNGDQINNAVITGYYPIPRDFLSIT